MTPSPTDDRPDDRRPLWMTGRLPDDPAAATSSPEAGVAGVEGDVEVVVVGAGLAGLTAALELSRAGRSVRVLEHRAVGAGATGATTAKVTSLHGATYRALVRRHGTETAAAYAAGNEAARAWMEQCIADLGVDVALEHRPAVTYTRDERHRHVIVEEHAAAVAAGLPARLTDSLDVPFPIAAAVVLEEGQFQFDPLRYLEALAAAAIAAGATVHQGTRALGLGAGGRRLVVETDQGPVRADHVLVCTATPFVDRGFFFARLEPLRAYLVAVEVEGALPRSMSISVDEPVRSLRTAPGPEGAELLLVGGAGHPVGRGGDTRGREAELLTWVDAAFGACRRVAGWSAQDYATLDGLPYVGGARGLPDGVRVATGFAKWGMTNATLAGRLLADDVLGRPHPRWAGALDAGRVDLTRSARRFVTLNSEVAGRLVAGHASSALARSGAAEQEGRVVRGTATARVDGRTCRVSGICPHLGGVLAWNPLERSWDCPLHGSRFSAEGRLLQGPAVNDLEARPPRED
ncbi:MAG: FAD-dependent oxidoreductase [Acidimicrobiales bacterium]|nr:FAD-dependent oxidoreductase [Acidimicrobiales bacterium]